MRRSQRLQPVVKLAERKEQQALNALAELQKQIQDEEKKVEELSQYRMEYQKGLNASGSINVAQLQSHQTFMAQLDNIISTQKDRRQQLDQEVKRLTDHYLLLHLKTKSLDTLVQKKRDEEKHIDAKNEQKILDELCLSRHKNSSL